MIVRLRTEHGGRTKVEVAKVCRAARPASAMRRPMRRGGGAWSASSLLAQSGEGEEGTNQP